jgi:hypothetical protein
MGLFGALLLHVPDSQVNVWLPQCSCCLFLPQVQDAVMASKRRVAPHLVAPIRRYATSKVSGAAQMPVQQLW